MGRRAYKDGEYTDLTITCGSTTFNVHQVVVCPPCAFFKQSLRFGKEAEEKCINLPEDDPEMIRRLIAYLYLGDYDPSTELALASFSNIKQHEVNTPAAAAHHLRYRKEALFESTNYCACLMPNTNQMEQPVSKLKPQGKPAGDFVAVKTTKTLEVANPLTIHASNVYSCRQVSG